MPTTRVNFRLPEALVERADLAAVVTTKTRTAIVTEALEAHLDSLAADDDFEEALVEQYLEGEVGFEALRRVLGRRDAEAVRSSAALLEEGEEIAARLAEDAE